MTALEHALKALAREDFPHILNIPTRWMDNDIYGHVNNVIYYAWFDTVINRYLIEEGGLDIHQGIVVGMAVETRCNFYRSVAFPETIEAGLRVGQLGNSSGRYEIGLFGEHQTGIAAFGHFVHVFVDRKTQTPVPIPKSIRNALDKLCNTKMPV